MADGGTASRAPPVTGGLAESTHDPSPATVTGPVVDRIAGDHPTTEQ